MISNQNQHKQQGRTSLQARLPQPPKYSLTAIGKYHYVKAITKAFPKALTKVYCLGSGIVTYHYVGFLTAGLVVTFKNIKAEC